MDLPPFLKKTERSDRQGVCQVEETVEQPGHECPAKNSICGAAPRNQQERLEGAVPKLAAPRGFKDGPGHH